MFYSLVSLSFVFCLKRNIFSKCFIDRYILNLFICLVILFSICTGFLHCLVWINTQILTVPFDFFFFFYQMSKSTGNFLTLSQAISKFSADGNISLLISSVFFLRFTNTGTFFSSVLVFYCTTVIQHYSGHFHYIGYSTGFCCKRLLSN